MALRVHMLRLECDCDPACLSNMLQINFEKDDVISQELEYEVSGTCRSV